MSWRHSKNIIWISINKFKPKVITDEVYYNLGLSGFPNKYLGVMYAEEYDLKYDLDIKLNFIDKVSILNEYLEKNKKFLVNSFVKHCIHDQINI